MQDFWAAYGAALMLGATHALEVDHMVAVGVFVGGRPRLGTATGFGLRWGLGHAAVVLIAGSALAWSNVRIPDHLTPWAEGLVGLMLMVLGTWAAVRTRRLHLHAPGSHGDHAHLHAHAPRAARHDHAHPHGSARRHRHLSTLVGALHGLAGTAPAVALIPVTLLPSRGVALGYLAAFGAGTTIAMGGYALLAALAVRRAADTPRGARIAGFATAAISVAVGGVWIARALMHAAR